KADERWKISADGGTQVRWKHDRSELFYVGLDGRLMAVPIRETADTKAIVAGTPAAVNADDSPAVRRRNANRILRGQQRLTPVPHDHHSAAAEHDACDGAPQLAARAMIR